MANSKKETVSNNRSSLTKPDGLSVPRVNSDISYGPGLIEMVAGDEPEEEKLAARSSSIIESVIMDDCTDVSQEYLIVTTLLHP